ncbi:hypothetical protein GZ77_06250 [Endozoicomonas montiporae]|uniref:Uncharacterized protein n=2 Tax=Endozoicomonas montiporae TaxID=1027273 RepID=A0A081NC88_9GAMM|nr:hypothetical protein EZMO1_2294 [Endozoicomonas montiporae CL-33]KEQ16061.1 hypothetical protein GZ77_06250 [Endozoicomonas montiporae]
MPTKPDDISHLAGCLTADARIKHASLEEIENAIQQGIRKSTKTAHPKTIETHSKATIISCTPEANHGQI